MATKAQEQAIRDYLTVLKDPSTLQDNSVNELQGRIESTDDPIERLRLRAKIEEARRPDTAKYENGFVQHAKAWADEHGVAAEAFRAEGVAPAVLRKAGFKVRGGGRSRATGRAASRRRTRVSAEEVKAAVPRGKFTVRQIQEATGASPAVVRRIVQEEVEADNVTEVGPDPDHKGPGRAATIYQRK